MNESERRDGPPVALQASVGHAEGLEIWNGQVWKQKEFPCFTIIVLMLEHIDGQLMFCKAGWNRFTPPLTMNEEDGKWMYTKEELLAQLKARKYTLIGCAEGGHLLDCEHLEVANTPISEPGFRNTEEPR